MTFFSKGLRQIAVGFFFVRGCYQVSVTGEVPIKFSSINSQKFHFLMILIKCFHYHFTVRFPPCWIRWLLSRGKISWNWDSALCQRETQQKSRELSVQCCIWRCDNLDLSNQWYMSCAQYITTAVSQIFVRFNFRGFSENDSFIDCTPILS